MDISGPIKPINPLQIVAKYSVSKKEFSQTPRRVNTIDLSTSHDTQASKLSSISLKDFSKDRKTT